MSTGVEQDAILLDAEKDLTNQFNTVLGATIAVCIVFLFVSIYFENLLTPIVEEEENSTTDYTPLWNRYKDNYQTNLENGTILEKGPYSLLETANEWNSTHVFVEYELPASEGGAGVTNDAKISLAYWLPNVPDGVKVPVIAEIGPYFQEPSVQTPTIEVPGSWLGQMIIDQILPHGYAFAQVSVTGTGRSNHCMDLMGTAEQLGNDAAVRWLGEQNWSNGNVGLIGKSYDGSTPWQAAMFGNEHDYLKTIVPISVSLALRNLCGEMEVQRHVHQSCTMVSMAHMVWTVMKKIIKTFAQIMSLAQERAFPPIFLVQKCLETIGPNATFWTAS